MSTTTSWLKSRLGPSISNSSDPAPPPSYDEKNLTSTTAPNDDDDDSSIPKPQVGELDPLEATSGGMGRHLGLTSTTLLIIGRIIGTGIFSTPASITKSVGSAGASIVIWVVGFCIAMTGLCVWIELGCMIPRSGGEKVYLEAAYRRPRLLATVFFAFQVILLGFSASGCIVFAQYILLAAGHTTIGEWQERGIAIGVIVFITLIHTVCPHIGVKGMNIVTFIKIGTILFIIVSGWAVLGGAVKDRIPDPGRSFRNSFAGTVASGNPWATALFKVLNAYTGWSNASYVVNEIKNPVRTLKIAGPLGLGACGIFYILVNISYFAAATPAEIKASGVTVASTYMLNVFGSAGSRAIAVLIALSAFGNVMSITFAQARVNQELAKEGVIPFSKFWASSWPFGSPGTGLFLHFIPSFIVIVAIPFGDAYSFILDLEGYPSSVINMFVVIGFFWLRYKEPNLPRPFRCWWPVAAFYLCAQIFLLVAPFLYPPGGKGDISFGPYYLYAVVGIGILLVGVVYWAVWIKLMPWIGGYTLVKQKEVLADGTVVMTYRKDKGL